MVDFLFLEGTGKPRTSYNRLFRSPIFPFTNSGTVTTGSTFLLDYHRDDGRTEKFGTFNNLRIQNSSTSEITVFANQDLNNAFTVEAGTTVLLDSEVLPGHQSLLIKNTGSNSITASQIRVLIWRNKTTQEDIISNMHKKFFDAPKNKNPLFQPKKLSGVL